MQIALTKCQRPITLTTTSCLFLTKTKTTHKVHFHMQTHTLPVIHLITHRFNRRAAVQLVQLCEYKSRISLLTTVSAPVDPSLFTLLYQLSSSLSLTLSFSLLCVLSGILLGMQFKWLRTSHLHITVAMENYLKASIWAKTHTHTHTFVLLGAGDRQKGLVFIGWV